MRNFNKLANLHNMFFKRSEAPLYDGSQPLAPNPSVAPGYKPGMKYKNSGELQAASRASDHAAGSLLHGDGSNLTQVNQYTPKGSTFRHAIADNVGMPRFPFFPGATRDLADKPRFEAAAASGKIKERNNPELPISQAKKKVAPVPVDPGIPNPLRRGEGEQTLSPEHLKSEYDNSMKYQRMGPNGPNIGPSLK